MRKGTRQGIRYLRRALKRITDEREQWRRAAGRWQRLAGERDQEISELRQDRDQWREMADASAGSATSLGIEVRRVTAELDGLRRSILSATAEGDLGNEVLREQVKDARKERDRAILVDVATARVLEQLGEKSNDEPPSDAPGYSLRFGALNLLVCTDEKSYATWRLGTAILSERTGPVARDEACDLFNHLRQLAEGPKT